MRKPPRSRLWKLFKWTAIVVFSVFAGLWLYLNISLAPDIKNVLEEQVGKASGGEYGLKIGKVRVNLLNFGLTFRDVTLVQDTTATSRAANTPAPGQLIIKIASLQVKRVRWWQYFSDKIINIGTLRIESPEVFVYKQKGAAKKPNPSKMTFPDGLPRLLGDKIRWLQVREVAVEGGTFSYVAADSTNRTHHLADSIEVSLRNIRMESAAHQTKPQVFPYANHTELSLRNYAFWATDGDYHLKVKRVTLTNGQSLRLESLALYPWNGNPKNVAKPRRANRFMITVPLSTTTGLELGGVFDRVWIAKKIAIYRPVFQILRDERMPQATGPGDAPPGKKKVAQPENIGKLVRKPTLDPLADILSQYARQLSVDTLMLDGGRLRSVALSSKGKATQSVVGVHVMIHKIRFDSASLFSAKDPYAYIKGIRMRMVNFRSVTPGSLYAVEIRKMEVPDFGSLRLDSLTITPMASAQAFKQQKKYRHDQYALTIPVIRVSAWKTADILNNAFTARSIHFDKAVVSVYRDKRLPRKPASLTPNPPLMPHELFRKIKFQLRIDTVAFHQASVSYSERDSGAVKAGKIVFEKTNITGTNLNNNPATMNRRRPFLVRANTLLMNQGLLKLDLAINLLDRDLRFAYEGELGAMEVETLNRIVLPITNVRFEGGHVRQVVFAANVSNGVARGYLEALYEDLKIGVMHSETKKERKLLSMLGNMLVKSGNANGKKRPARMGEIYYERAIDDTFLRLLWLSARTGLITSMTPNKTLEIRQRVQDRQEANKARRESKRKSKENDE